MKELVLVRHGEAEHLVKGIVGGWTDLPLTDRGRRQTEITGTRLMELFESRIQKIYASDLIRASEAAKIIQEKLDVPLIIDSHLRELNQGVAKNMTHEEAAKVAIPMSEPSVDWTPYPEAESWRMLQERVAEVMSELEQKEEDVVLIVGHGNTNAVIVEWWLQLPSEHNIYFPTHPASITWLGINDFGDREIRKLNETAHLTNEGLDDCVSQQ
ncbi:MAG: histidine phosphatase family protein [Candidatus Thorarchaeota archaeon]|nr:MAG: histidine phosphatase family protein [Candidatus Thorarchaeota archaeon]